MLRLLKSSKSRMVQHDTMQASLHLSKRPSAPKLTEAEEAKGRENEIEFGQKLSIRGEMLTLSSNGHVRHKVLRLRALYI